MIFTLTGSNEYLLGRFVSQKQQSFLDKYGDIAVERVNCADVDFDRISESIQSLPFLAAAKLVILDSPSLNKKFSESFADLIETVPENIELLIIEPKLDKRTGLYKTLKSKTDFQEFSELDIAGLARWLVEEAKDRTGSISSSDARFLVERVGSNQLLLSNELDKLIMFNPDITKQEIEKLTTRSPQSSIFDLIEAAMSGNAKKALQLYEEQRRQRVEAQQIIAMLTWQLHILAIIKTAGDRSSQQIAADAKLNPYVVSKSMNLARNMTYKDLKKHISDLYELDLQAKQTSINVDDSLQGYIIGLQKTLASS